jgi:DNA/RNA-binding protein KIN17
MGKGDKNSEPKVIAKKMKYGHLQKLKWYCEICQHQSNDEQSYRQHVQCEKHRLMMVHFRSNKDSVLKSNSHIFECTFMDVLRRRFPNREVPANVVYTQVIRDKNHVHMNSTRWESVHGFCMHLESCNKIRMRMTERGPMIRYIDQDADLNLPTVSAEMNKAELAREQVLIAEMWRHAPQTEEPHEIIEEQPVDEVIKIEKKTPAVAVASIFGASAKSRVAES